MVKSLLVVGADGLLGQAMVHHWKVQGGSVLETSRKRQGEGIYSLDLSADPASWPELPKVDCAILCAAMTNMAACKENPGLAERINVSGTLALAERLVEQGAFVLFVSSSQVFDGEEPFPRIDSVPNPVSLYGQQKLAVEQALLGLGNCGIIRVTKVMDRDAGLLQGWAKALKAGEPITPFSDLTLSPVLPEDFAEAASSLLAAEALGVYHLSGDEEIPYSKLAEALAAKLGVDPVLVKAVSVEESGVTLEHHPKHNALGMGFLEKRFGLEAVPVAKTLESLVG